MSSTTKRPIVLVTVDCLRADRLGRTRNGRSITPFLDELATRSTSFRRAYVAGSPTYNSFPGLMASRHPTDWGRDVASISPAEDTLATALQGAGYATGAVVAGNPYLSRRFGYDRGFEYFDDNIIPDARIDAVPEKKRALGKIYERILDLSRDQPKIRALLGDFYFQYRMFQVGRRVRGDYERELRFFPEAEAINRKAAAWIDEQHRRERPFFLWVHYMDAHRPYLPPRSALEAIGRKDLSSRRIYALRELWLRRDLDASRLAATFEDMTALYDACVLAADRAIEQLYTHAFATMGELDFVVTADHGEAFLERGVRDHDPVLASEELVNVPLLMHHAGAEPRRVAQPISLIDVAPTILGRAGVTPPAGFQGTDRSAAIARGADWRDPVLIEMPYGFDVAPKSSVNRARSRMVAVVDTRYKLVANFQERSFVLFDLLTDAGEKQPIPISDRREIAEPLLVRLFDHQKKQLERRRTAPELAVRFKWLSQRMFDEQRGAQNPQPHQR